MFAGLVADDIFISYSRGDASAYADGLADALVRRGFSVFIDRLGTEANRDIPATLLAKLHGAQMLVLVGSPAAAASSFVGQEVREFARVRRSDRIVPIDFDGALPRAAWYDAVVGIALEAEAMTALSTGEASPRVVARVDKAYQYTRSKQRLRRYTQLALALLVTLLLASAGASWYAQLQISAAAVARQETEQSVAAAVAASAAARTAMSQARSETLRAERMTEAASAAAARATQALALAHGQQRIALSRQLAAAAAGSLDDRLDLAALWAAESWRAAPTREAREALFAVLTREPRVVALLAGQTSGQLAPPADGGLVPLVRPVPGAAGAEVAGTVSWFDASTTGLRARGVGQPVPAAVQPDLGDAERAAFVVGDHVLVIERTGGRLRVPLSGSLWHAAALGPAGSLLTVQSIDAGRRVAVTRWQLEQPQARLVLRREFDATAQSVEALAADGRRVALSRGDALEVFDLDTAQFRRLATFERSPYRSMEFSERVAFLSGGQWLAYDQWLEGARRVTHVIDARTGARQGQVLAGRLISASAQGAALVLGQSDQRVQAWDVRAGRALGPPLQALRHNVDDARLSPDGRWATARVGRQMLVFDLERQAALGRPLPGAMTAFHLAWPAPGQLAAAGPDGLQVWAVDALGHVTPAPRRSDVVAFALARGAVALKRRDGRLSWVRDLAATAVPSTPALESDALRIAVDHAGRAVVIEGRHHTMFVWRPPAGPVRQRALEGRAQLGRVAFAADGRRAALGFSGSDAPLQLWHLDTDRAEPMAGHNTGVSAMSTSNDGRWLASGATEVVLRAWHAPLQPLWQREVDDQVESLAFSADDERLAVGLANGRIELWDRIDGRAYTVTFTHDSVAEDDQRRIAALAFDAQGRWLASADLGGAIWLWRIDAGDWARQACLLAGRALTAHEWRAQRRADVYDPACRAP